MAKASALNSVFKKYIYKPAFPIIAYPPPIKLLSEPKTLES